MPGPVDCVQVSLILPGAFCATAVKPVGAGGAPLELNARNKSTFGPLEPTVVRRTVLLPELKVALLLTNTHSVQPPVEGKLRLLLTTTPLTFNSSGRSVVLPLA